MCKFEGLRNPSICPSIHIMLATRIRVYGFIVHKANQKSHAQMKGTPILLSGMEGTYSWGPHISITSYGVMRYSKMREESTNLLTHKQAKVNKVWNFLCRVSYNPITLTCIHCSLVRYFLTWHPRPKKWLSKFFHILLDAFQTIRAQRWTEWRKLSCQGLPECRAPTICYVVKISFTLQPL